jgi:hypothetical protein
MSSEENPFLPTDKPTQSAKEGCLVGVAQRALAAFLFLAGWIAIGMGNMLIMRKLVPELANRDLRQDEMTLLQSYAFFSERYWFVGLILLSPPLVAIMWFVLKRRGTQTTRWKLLVVGLLTAPLLIVLAWLLLNPLLA